jgi:hypothetical protein
MRTTWLMAAYVDAVDKRKKKLQDAFHLTIAADGWSNVRMQSVVAGNVIIPSNNGREVELLGSMDASLERHTAPHMAGRRSCCVG